MAERPEDFNLPVAVVSRLLKENLPEGIAVSKEAKAAFAKAASIFVLYSTSLSNNFAVKAKRKTVTGQDVISAMDDMELEDFIPQLEEALEAFRKDKSAKNAKKKDKAKEKEVNKPNKESDSVEGEDAVMAEDGGSDGAAEEES